MKVVLAYSGGLDTSVILHYLSYEKGYDVIAYYADVGQEDEDLTLMEKKAKLCGAEKVIVDDKTSELSEVAKTSILSNARYETTYLLGTALARPIIAKGQVDIAQEEQATLCHGATGKGNDQVRFELAYKHLAPNLPILSPWKNKEFLAKFNSREDLLAYAKNADIPIESTHKVYSIDDNLLHTSYEGGSLENPKGSSAPLLKCCSTHQPLNLKIKFSDGLLSSVELDGQEYKNKEAFLLLKNIGKKYKIAKDIWENRFIGLKSRGVYFQAALEIPFAAHLYLENIYLPKELFHLTIQLGETIGKAIYEGKFYSKLVQSLFAWNHMINKNIDGEVEVLVKPNTFLITSANLQNEAHIEKLKTGSFSMKDFSPEHATGFIELISIQEGY